jgi:hypothetical protein
VPCTRSLPRWGIRCTLHVARCTLLLAACGRATHVEIVASLEPGVPLEGLEVVALPYDPERLLDSLAALAPTPRPDYSALEAELLAFRRPSYQEDDESVRAWGAVRDSVNRLSDSLRGVDRRAPGYAAAYERFRRLYERFLQRTAARDAQVRQLTAEVRDLAIRAGRGADSLRAWEQQAYAAADSAARLTQAATGRAAVWGATDATGQLSFTVPNGDWWLQALVPHRENPFVELAWNAPMSTAGLPFRIRLDAGTARARWRH